MPAPRIPDLQGISPTGYYRFSGKPLTEEDVSNLKARGVKFIPYEDGGDLMPDGKRIKHPRLRSDWIARAALSRAKKFPTPTPEEIEANDNERRRDYDALPEPKPDYFEWASRRERQQHYLWLERLVFSSKSEHTRLRAINTMLEFGLARPKKAIEISTAGEEELTKEQVLELALELHGIDKDKFYKFLGDNPEALGTYSAAK